MKKSCCSIFGKEVIGHTKHIDFNSFLNFWKNDGIKKLDLLKKVNLNF